MILLILLVIALVPVYLFIGSLVSAGLIWGFKIRSENRGTTQALCGLFWPVPVVGLTVFGIGVGIVYFPAKLVARLSDNAAKQLQNRFPQ